MSFSQSTSGNALERCPLDAGGAFEVLNAKVSCDGRQQDRRGMSSLSINEISHGPAAAAVQQYQIMPPNDTARWQTSGSVEMTSSFGSKHSACSAGRLVHTRQLLLFTTVSSQLRTNAQAQYGMWKRAADTLQHLRRSCNHLVDEDTTLQCWCRWRLCIWLILPTNRLSRYRFEQKHSPAHGMSQVRTCCWSSVCIAMSVAWAHCHREQHKVRHAVASGIWSWLAKRSFPCDASACAHFIH